MMAVKTSTGVELDTDAVSPDSLRAAFDVAVDKLARRGAVNWNSLEFALRPVDAETTHLVLRAEIL